MANEDEDRILHRYPFDQRFYGDLSGPAMERWEMGPTGPQPGPLPPLPPYRGPEGDLEELFRRELRIDDGTNSPFNLPTPPAPSGAPQRNPGTQGDLGLMDEMSAAPRRGFDSQDPYRIPTGTWDQPPPDQNEAYRPGMDPRTDFELSGGVSGVAGRVGNWLYDTSADVAGTIAGGMGDLAAGAGGFVRGLAPTYGSEPQTTETPPTETPTVGDDFGTRFGSSFPLRQDSFDDRFGSPRPGGGQTITVPNEIGVPDPGEVWGPRPLPGVSPGEQILPSDRFTGTSGIVVDDRVWPDIATLPDPDIWGPRPLPNLGNPPILPSDQFTGGQQPQEDQEPGGVWPDLRQPGGGPSFPFPGTVMPGDTISPLRPPLQPTGGFPEWQPPVQTVQDTGPSGDVLQSPGVSGVVDSGPRDWIRDQITQTILQGGGPSGGVLQDQGPSGVLQDTGPSGTAQSYGPRWQDLDMGAIIAAQDTGPSGPIIYADQPGGFTSTGGLSLPSGGGGYDVSGGYNPSTDFGFGYAPSYGEVAHGSSTYDPAQDYGFGYSPEEEGSLVPQGAESVKRFQGGEPGTSVEGSMNDPFPTPPGGLGSPYPAPTGNYGPSMPQTYLPTGGTASWGTPLAAGYWPTGIATTYSPGGIPYAAGSSVPLF